jgi:hypothetical protein
LMRFPAIPDVPGHLRGRAFAIITAIHLGAPAEADALLAPLRALGPVTDTVQTIPVTELLRLHMDPDHPVPSVADWLMLASLPAAAIEQFARAFGTEAGQALLAVELIHVGGEMKRARPGNGALAAIDADYALFAGGMAPTAQAASAVSSAVKTALTTMSPWAARQMYLNLTDTRRDPASFWTPQAYERLRRIKAAVDPDDLIRSNHPVPPLPTREGTPS